MLQFNEMKLNFVKLISRLHDISDIKIDLFNLSWFNLQNFETIRLSDSKTRVEAIACDGEMADVTFIVANINGDMHVFKLTSAGAMELLLKVPDDVNNMVRSFEYYILNELMIPLHYYY